jgi:Uma2 family endonuclease
MSVAAPHAESRVVLRNVRWETFEALLSETDRAGTRFTYDRGVLEITSPSYEHERIKTLIRRMIDTITLELDIPLGSSGSTTLKAPSKDRGLEPDESYYLAHELEVRSRCEIDLAIDPPPDLAVEVDITSSSLDQLAIYGSLGVPEVWLCDGVTIRVYQLQAGGAYAERERSPSFPFLPLEQIEQSLQQRSTVDETTLIRRFLEEVRRLKR